MRGAYGALAPSVTSLRAATQEPLRLAVLFHRFGPYHHARLRAVANAGEVTGIEFTRVDKTYQWALIHGSEGFHKITLFDDRDTADVKRSSIEQRMSDVLRNVNPSMIAVPGWGSIGALLALRWAVSSEVPAIVMSETMERDTSRSFVTEMIKGRIVRMFAGGIVGGRAHRDYLLRLGLRSDRIALGYDCVDNEYFRVASSDAKRKGGEIRFKYNLPEKFFLASSRFIERKNIRGLLAAHARYCRDTPDAWHLVLLGDGPLREDFEALAARTGDSRVLMPGFVQYGDLPKYYGLAQAFIHASTAEPWGLVVNEAMASGLPVLVSKQSGCADELVREEENGFTFDANDEQSLVQLMIRMSSGELSISAMGSKSAEIVSQWSTDRFAAELWRLATVIREDVVAVRPRFIDRALLRMAIVL